MDRILEPPSDPIVIQTRTGKNIPAEPPRLPLTPEQIEGMRIEFRHQVLAKLNFPDQIIERRPPTNAYNCHGLTFLSRRAWFEEPLGRDDRPLRMVLQEDGYREVEATQVKPGDIAVWEEGGVIVHTGVVVWMPDGPSESRLPVPWVVSKWGKWGEYLHRSSNNPYRNATCRFMREGYDE
jgi:hypothetical protein